MRHDAFRRAVGVMACMASLCGCAETVSAHGANDAAVSAADAVDAGPSCVASGEADLLFEVANSNSMEPNQAQFAAVAHVLFDALTTPLTNLHVGVISPDLGTPGSEVPSCANTDIGDDGVLNPIRNGMALMQHEPWTSAPAGLLPAQCMSDPNQYPNFLTFDATMIVAGSTTYQDGFATDFVCNAFLSIDGCGLGAQLEAVYRALVIHNPRDVPGNTDVNAGFVRDDALLAILFLTDHEDGSVRDCRYAELDPQGHPLPCVSGIGVYSAADPNWSSSDLSLRFEMYTPLGPQDPTWTLDRYMDPTNPARGYTGLKPGHPERVIVGAITGVPLPADMPTQPDGDTDWNAMLGTNPDGSDGLVGNDVNGGGPFSMKQANPDPNCPSRVIPACRREGTTYNPNMAATECDATQQYFARPGRRIAELMRNFDQTYQNGFISSVCQSDYSGPLTTFAERIQQRACP